MAEEVINIGDYSCNTSKVIGKGKHSIIYEGNNVDGTMKVAVKKINWSTITNKGKHDNLRMKLQQALEVHKTKKTHEHTLKLFDFKEIQDEAFIVCELCDDTLENYLDSKPLSEEVALDLFKQAAAIVYHKFATAHKFLNREVSPPNLLIVKKGDNVQLKFADIALGKFAETKELTWPCYYAPEIVSQQEFIDKRKAEVFSLGLILYRFLAGHLPYNTHSELEAELRKENPFALPESVSEITEHTRNLLKRALQVHPDNRMPLPALLKKFGYDLPEPGSLRYSSSQGDLSTEMLLVKIEEATEEIVNLKERIRRLEAEKLEVEMQVNLKMEQNDLDVHQQLEKMNEDLQGVRQELGDALEQILKADEQYDALDARKRQEIDDLMHQLVQAHEALEEMARKTTEEVVGHKRNIEELKDTLEGKQEEIQALKKEHEMVELFRQQELTTLKKELDDLTEYFVQMEETRREEDDRANNRYDEMVRFKDQEIAEIRKQFQGGAAKSNGIGTSKAYSSYSSSNLRPTSPDAAPSKSSWGSRSASPNPPSMRPSSTSPEPNSSSSGVVSMTSPQHVTWTAPQYAATNKPTALTPTSPSLTSAVTPSKWTPPAKTTTVSSPKPAATTSTSSASKWTPPAKATTTPSSTTVGQKPAWMAGGSKPAASAATSSSSTATSASAPSSSAAAASAPVAAYTGTTFTASELRVMLKDPSSAFDGFDKTQIEQYLNETEFQHLFGMSKGDYNKLPKWKQAPLKSKAKLF